MYAALRERFDVIQTGELIQNFVTDNRSTINEYLTDFQKNNPSDQQLKIGSSTKREHAEWFDGQCELFVIYINDKDNYNTHRFTNNIGHQRKGDGTSISGSHSRLLLQNKR